MSGPVSRALERLLSWAGGFLAALAVGLPPVLYFALSWQHQAGMLEAEVELDAHAVTQIVGANPDLWRFEQLRLVEVLSRSPRGGDAECRRVLDLAGAPVTELCNWVPGPVLTRTHALYDAGTVVGSVQLTRSVRPILLRAGLFALLLLPIAAVAHRLLRTIPLRALRRAEEALARSEALRLEEQRRLQEQLHQAQKLEAIGRLAGGVAHDFNNILCAIKGYAGLLRGELPADDPRRPDADEVLAAAERGVALTRGLLTFSRRQELERQAVELCSLLRATERLLRPLLRDGVRLSLELPAEPVVALADPVQVEQVVMNLVTNARDALSGRGRVTVTLAQVELDAAAAHRAGLEASGAYARLAVQDDGPGISAETRARMFEPFFTTKEVGKGTGLGLAIAYGIVQRHRGAIEVTSAPGEGATFACYLPLDPVPGPVASA